MPLTAKGTEILASMRKEYGEKRGEEIFYASKNAHKITGVDSQEGAVIELRKAIEAGELESEAEAESVQAGKHEAEHQKAALAELTKDEKCCPNGDISAVAQDKREYDTNNWYEVLDNPLSKVGVYQYSGRSIGGDADPTKMYGVFRPPEELGAEETVKSFRLMPWTDDHPNALLGPREQGLVPAEEKGVHGVIGEKTYFRADRPEDEDGTLYGNLKIFSESLRQKVPGKRELSCGYHCQFIRQDGIYKGEPYQYVQRNLRGNHVASVDQGRMGSSVRVLDSAERLTFALDLKEIPAMAEKRKDEAEGTVDADTLEFIGKQVGDSFNSLVGELERKSYSKEYATKIAGKVAAEKGMTGHHDSTDSIGVKSMSGTAADATTETKTEEERKKEAADRRAARDSKRGARDSRRAMDEMSEEESEAEDAAECAEDAEEEKEDEKDDSKEARDRRSARDRRAGARDARKMARDRARDKAAKDAAKDKGKGMDAAEVAALVEQRIRDVAPAMRREAAAVHKLYQRLSPVIGAFDHDEMSVTEMAAYGLKKLGAPEAKTDPVTALDFYLAGRAQAQPEPPVRSAAHDASDESFVGKYLNS